MKKLFLIATLWCVALGILAQKPVLSTESASRIRLAAPLQATAQPAGQSQYYLMNAMVYGSRGITYEEGMANQLVFDGSGAVYIRTFFPLEGEKYAFWHKGKVYEHQILISKDDVVYQFESDGVTYEVKLGDMTLDAWGVSAVRDVLLEYDSDSGRIYVDDDADAPERYIGLYVLDAEGQVQVIDYTLIPSLIPFEPGELNVVPSDATVEKYIYYTTNYYDEPSAVEGTVAILGNDYYFDHLTKGGGIVRGTREGNKVTISTGQYIGCEIGYFLYAGGYHTNWEADDNGDLVGENSSLTLTIDADGKTLRLDDPEHYFATTYRNDGLWYEYSFNHRIEPYIEKGVQTPADPTDLILQSYSPWMLFHCKVSNIDVDGKALNLDNLSARFFINGEAFTFTPTEFKNLSASMDIIPYGFCDVYPDGDDIYSGQNKYVILFNNPDIKTIGVQFFYTVDGKTSCSRALSVDVDGNIEEFIPTGLTAVETGTTPSLYGLDGRILPHRPHHGVYITDGKKVMVK